MDPEKRCCMTIFGESSCANRSARQQEFERLTDAEVADVEEPYRASFMGDAEPTSPSRPSAG
jgi:hypothetical protein